MAALLLCTLKPAAVRDAQARAQAMKVLKNSFMKGKGSEVGFAGERGLVEVLKAIGFEASIANDYQYDIGVGLKKSGQGGQADQPQCKLEVKTKTTTVAPLPHYDNSVSAFNANQAADVYVFLRVQWASPVQKDLGGKLWFCGFLPCAEFKRRGRHVEKGARDGDNGYLCRSECWSVPIRECGTWDDFVSYLDKGRQGDAPTCT